MNIEAQRTKHREMPKIGRACCCAPLVVVASLLLLLEVEVVALLKGALLVGLWLLASFGSRVTPLVWKKGRLAAKSLFACF